MISLEFYCFRWLFCIGWLSDDHQQMLEMIHQAIAGEELSVDNQEIYFFKDGQTFHEGG